MEVNHKLGIKESAVLNELLTYLAKDANLTNAFATVTSAVIALAALIISVVSLFVSRATLKSQHRHNVLSVTPIPMVSVADYEGRLTVKILNNGSGPLIIRNVQVKKESQVRESLIDWMPPLPDGMYWSTFVGPIENRSLLPGNEIKLLELTGDHPDKKFEKFRDECRAALCPLTVALEYADVYGSAFSHTQSVYRGLEETSAHPLAERLMAVMPNPPLQRDVSPASRLRAPELSRLGMSMIGRRAEDGDSK